MNSCSDMKSCDPAENWAKCARLWVLTNAYKTREQFHFGFIFIIIQCKVGRCDTFTKVIEVDPVEYTLHEDGASESILLRSPKDAHLSVGIMIASSFFVVSFPIVSVSEKEEQAITLSISIKSFWKKFTEQNQPATQLRP